MQRIFPRYFCVKLTQGVLILLALSAFANAADEIPAIQPPIPHIALLLPLNSQGLGPSAETIHQGILAAAGVHNNSLPVRVYSDFDDSHSVVAAYRDAIANGAVAVIGPLTRNRISQLANQPSIPVPTLALNLIEGLAPPQLYFFGMAVEAEARQVAMLARQQGMQQAIVISSRAPLAQRLQFAFEEQWIASGGMIAREIDYNGDPMVFSDVAATENSMVFFATDAENARAIRPYLPNNMSTYGTSQLFAGNQARMLNFDFEGARFVDMPWLMQRDLAPSVNYPRSSTPLATDQERLYALGIDAYRLINLLISKQATVPMDGVTGRITLRGQIFDRLSLPAVFAQGHAQAADAPIVHAEAMFPGMIKSASSVEAPDALAQGQ